MGGWKQEDNDIKRRIWEGGSRNDSKRRIWEDGSRKRMTVNGEYGRVEAGRQCP